MGRLNFKELSNERIKERRNVVISQSYDTDGVFVGYSIAEQLVIQEDGEEVKMFLKGGLGIVSDSGMLQLKLAVDNACKRVGIIN